MSELKTLRLWESYVGTGAPNNAAGRRSGLGWTKSQASKMARHWNNHVAWERFRRVTLVDLREPEGGAGDMAYLAWNALDYLEIAPTLDHDEQAALAHLRACRYASAWIAVFPPPEAQDGQ